METEIQERGYAFEWTYGSIFYRQRIYMRSEGVNITNETLEANVRYGTNNNLELRFE